MAVSEALTFYFISSVSSILVVFLGVVYKSKCRVISCCGCIRIERDVDAEERIDEMEIGKTNNNTLSQIDIIHHNTQPI